MQTLLKVLGPVLARIADALLDVALAWRRHRDYQARQEKRDHAQADPYGAFADHFGNARVPDNGHDSDAAEADKTDA